MALLTAEHVFTEVSLDTKAAALHYLAESAQTLQITTDVTAVFKSFNEREAEGSTGMMEGFAIPHAKSPAITEASIVIMKIQKAIDWDSLDGQPTEIIIALFIPEQEAGTTHLTLLSKVARLLMKSDFKQQLKQQASAVEIADYVNQKLIEE